MSHKEIVLMAVCVLIVFAFGVDALAQPANQQAKPTAKQEEDNAKKRAAQETSIKEAKAKIEKNCTSLKDAIISANAASSELPYDDNEIDDGNFETYCQQGKLVWTAKRQFSSDDKEKTTYNLKVTADKAHQLGNSRVMADGLVQLISETPSITVDDGTSGDSKQVKWGLDLREEEYAQRFVLALKDLAANLKTKMDAEKKLAEIPAPPALPDQKGKPKK